MKQRLGGLFVTALGAVLIAGGVSADPAITIGGSAPCGVSPLGVTSSCPTGTITFTENDVIKQGSAPSPSPTPTETPQSRRGAAGADAGRASGPTPPASWTVTITAENCNLPSGDNSTTVTVPDGGSATSDPLFIYSSTSGSTACEYDYTETPVAGWYASYDPAPPQPIPYNGTSSASRSGHAAPDASSNGNLGVALTNTAYVAATTPSPTPTATPTRSAQPSPSQTTGPGVSTSARPLPTPTRVLSGHRTLPDTGSRHLGAMVWLGAVLVLLGGGLVAAPSLAGRRRRRDGELS